MESATSWEAARPMHIPCANPDCQTVSASTMQSREIKGQRRMVHIGLRKSLVGPRKSNIRAKVEVDMAVSYQGLVPLQGFEDGYELIFCSRIAGHRDVPGGVSRRIERGAD